MTKEQFLDWKNHPVTQEIQAEIRFLINEGRDMLEGSAGSDSYRDAKVSGKLEGLRTILEIDFVEEAE